MVAPDIRGVYAHVLREIVKRRELAKQVCLEVFFNGQYEEREEDSSKGFAHAFPEMQDIGYLFYRGAEGTGAEQRNGFYFVTTPHLVDIKNTRLLQIAGDLEKEGGLVRTMEIIYKEHVIYDARTRKEKAKVTRQLRRRRLQTRDSLFVMRPKNSAPQSRL
jgi:hypothetical protein